MIFEHGNYAENAAGLRQYFSDPTILAADAPRFEGLFGERKELALRLKARIAGRADVPARWRRRLDRMRDPYALRLPDRQRILTERGIVDPWDLEPSLWQRARTCVRDKGWRGLAKALRSRLIRATAGRRTPY